MPEVKTPKEWNKEIPHLNLTDEPLNEAAQEQDDKDNLEHLQEREEAEQEWIDRTS